MSKAKQKQLEFLRQQKQKRQNEFRQALKRILDSQETLRICLNFAEQYLNQPFQQSLEEYSPTHISRMVFQSELARIKEEFGKLPNSECRVEHFILIMMRVIKFPFEKIPLFMIGLKDMFFEIVDEGKDFIGYEKFFKYIVGEVVTLKEEEQNTEFQVHFEQNKKQDYLLHDNGIKRTLYTGDLKVVMSLDERESMIKFYDQDMRNINRYCGKKQAHGGKVPMVVDFDYSQMTMRLGVIFPDSVLESIHLPNYLHKTQQEFQQTTLNLLSFNMACKMRRIYYLQMLNKWLTISQQDNLVYLYDMEKARSKPQEVQQKIQIDNNDLQISIVLEIVAISTVCFVAGNQITFYNESLSQKKFSRFSHHEIITILRYSEQTNTFYLVGREEKNITMFSIARNQSISKIRTFAVNKVISDFQVFPYFDAILVSDDTHDLRLIHQPTKNTYQTHSLANIVKMKDKFLRIQKTSKSQFIIFQTYMLNFALQKVAIQKQIQYNFLNSFYFDSRKDQFYLSVNNQIISFSLIYGEIRKNYCLDTSNIQKHQCFFLGPKTPPFIFDTRHNLYQIYMKSQQTQGENKNYKKKILMGQLVASFYDEQMRSVMLVNEDSVHLIRNDCNNNFNPINNIYFKGISKVIQAIFCKKTKYITIMTVNHVIYQLRNFQTHFNNGYKFSFLRAENDAQEKIVVQYDYCSHYQLLILLNNKNQVVIVERLNVSNYVVVKITDHLSYKFKHLVFGKFSYHLVKEKNIHHPSIILYDDSGYLFDLDLKKIVTARFLNTKKQETVIRSFMSESYEVGDAELVVEEMVFNSQQKVKLTPGEFCFLKAHEKQIVIGTKIYLDIIAILTISKDGVIKLWNQQYTVLFVLKIPFLLKLTWNMKEIQNIKNAKSINQLKAIIDHNYSAKNHPAQPIEAITKTRRIKHYVQPAKKFKFSEDLPLEIQSKEIEDILLQEQDYRKGYQTYRTMKPKLKLTQDLSKTIDVHPWRNRKQFVKLYERASPPHKYKEKIPQDLLTLRTSLDMSQRRKQTPNYKPAESILPQLKLYENQKAEVKKEFKKESDRQQFENFESCLYIKTNRRRKKPNELDQIDKEFLRKQIALQNRRWIPKQGREKVNSSIEIGQPNSTIIDQNRHDTIKDIQTVFQEHNKQCIEQGRGRIIHLNKISLIKDYI